MIIYSMQSSIGHRDDGIVCQWKIVITGLPRRHIAHFYALARLPVYSKINLIDMP